MNKITATLLLCLFLLGVWGCKNPTPEYRTDLEPIINRFSAFSDIQKCYWKTSVDSENTRLLPTPDHWMMGFFIPSTEQFELLKEEYEWTFPQIEFSGYNTIVDPDIVKSDNEKKWGYNQAFNDFALPEHYVGNIYLDLNNGIIFFNISTQ